MRRQELGHPEGAEPFVPKDLGHLLIRRHVALVVRVLQVVLLEVGPNLLDALRAGGLILADDVSEVVGELVRLACASGHASGPQPPLLAAGPACLRPGMAAP